MSWFTPFLKSMRLALLAASVVVLILHPDARAQGTAAAPRPAGVGEIQGRLTDSTSGQPITRGSITIRRQRDTVFVGGALPKPDGTFRVDGLAPGEYTLRFRAIGFEPIIRKDLVVTMDKPIVNVGTITPAVAVTKLEGLEITV